MQNYNQKTHLRSTSNMDAAYQFLYCSAVSTKLDAYIRKNRVEEYILSNVGEKDLVQLVIMLQ